MRWWSFGPDEFTVFVTLGEDAYKARLSIEYAAYVCVCDTSVAPSCVYSYAHLVFVEVTWNRLTLVIELRGTSCRRALCEIRANCQLVEESVLCTWPWWRGCDARSSVRWSGTRHSLESGMRGMRSVYALPTSLMIVSW